MCSLFRTHTLHILTNRVSSSTPKNGQDRLENPNLDTGSEGPNCGASSSPEDKPNGSSTLSVNDNECIQSKRNGMKERHNIPWHVGSSPDQRPSKPHSLISLPSTMMNPESHECVASLPKVVFSMNIWPFRGGRRGPQSIFGAI